MCQMCHFIVAPAPRSLTRDRRLGPPHAYRAGGTGAAGFEPALPKNALGAATSAGVEPAPPEIENLGDYQLSYDVLGPVLAAGWCRPQ